MSTRYVGTCAVCARSIRVRGGNLVHHGYQRPGYGHIVGDCFAVGRTPHESSPETAKAYREYLEVQLEERETSKAHVEKADQLHYSYTVHTAIREKKTAFADVKRGDAARYEGNDRIPSFADVQKGVIHRLVHEIKSCRDEIARMSGLEATWVEKPLETVEEERRRVSEQARVERERVKAERDAKKAVKSARKAERDARLQVKIDAAKKRAHALLDAVDPTDLHAVRQAYLEVLEIKLPDAVRYTFYDDHLDRTELLRSAGLTRSHNGSLMSNYYEVREVIVALMPANLY